MSKVLGMISSRVEYEEEKRKGKGESQTDSLPMEPVTEYVIDYESWRTFYRFHQWT
jgi:hypothetical protein